MIFPPWISLASSSSTVSPSWVMCLTTLHCNSYYPSSSSSSNRHWENANSNTLFVHLFLFLFFHLPTDLGEYYYYYHRFRLVQTYRSVCMHWNILEKGGIEWTLSGQIKDGQCEMQITLRIWSREREREWGMTTLTHTNILPIHGTICWTEKFTSGGGKCRGQHSPARTTLHRIFVIIKVGTGIGWVLGRCWTS